MFRKKRLKKLLKEARKILFSSENREQTANIIYAMRSSKVQVLLCLLEGELGLLSKKDIDYTQARDIWKKDYLKLKEPEFMKKLEKSNFYTLRPGLPYSLKPDEKENENTNSENQEAGKPPLDPNPALIEIEN